MKRFLLSAALTLFTVNVYATESLIFDGGGYTIQILVGSLEKPIVAQVHFMSPGTEERVVLPRELLQIEEFDMDKEVLTMHFSNKDKPDLPGSFSLSVKKNKAVLSINGKEIKSDFDWEI